MSEDNDTFLENETKFWDGKRDDNPESNESECCESECSGNCDCKDDKATMTFCGERCDETCGQCLNCEIADIWMKIIRGESSKEFIDAWIIMKTLLIGIMKDTYQESDAIQKMNNEVQALQILRDRQKE
jgi:hypothetical protein